tara:strand:+ start:3058 stop:3975 length:918 start_codon:yes stop_codon:yes gene_type:complete
VKKNFLGFTLAEVLVAVVIGIISVAAAFSAYNYYSKSYDAVTQKSAVNSSARDALILITKDLRNAGYIDPNFLSASCENITTELDAKKKLISLSSKKSNLSGKYGQSDYLALWYSISPKERKQVFYWIAKEQNSNDYYLSRDVKINPEGRKRGTCSTNNAYTHPVNNEMLVANVEDFQIIFKDKDGNILVPVCSIQCGTVEQSQGNGNTVATKYGNMTQGQANQELVHTADIYITVRSPKEIYKSNRSFQLRNGETTHGGSINVPADKYFRETFFASVHTRNLATPQVPISEDGRTASEGAGYNE